MARNVGVECPECPQEASPAPGPSPHQSGCPAPFSAPHPRALPCLDRGGLWEPGERRPDLILPRWGHRTSALAWLGSGSHSLSSVGKGRGPATPSASFLHRLGRMGQGLPGGSGPLERPRSKMSYLKESLRVPSPRPKHGCGGGGGECRRIGGAGQSWPSGSKQLCALPPPVSPGQSVLWLPNRY